MTDDKKENEVISKKQGISVYVSNPSVPETMGKRYRRTQIGSDREGIVVHPRTGEVLGEGGALIYQWKEVDNEAFVKLYLEGIRQAAHLTKSGFMIFEVVYNILHQEPNQDRIMMNFYMASQCIEGLQERTYRRGVRELLEKEFLFRTPSDGVFFVNIRFMFNGDRLAFVKGYIRKNSRSSQLSEKPAQTIPEIEHQQPETPLLPEPIENPSPEPDEQGSQMNLFRE